MAAYRLLPNTGTHRQGGVNYRGGDVVESDVDLVALFPQKFEKTAPTQPQSIDVTDSFPEAGRNGLRVEQRGGWYYLIQDELEVSGALRLPAVDDAVFDWVEKNAD